MSLFGSFMGDVEDDPFFGSHMRHMRQMNNMMNSLFSDPFGMLGGGGPLSIMGPRHGGGMSMMPLMPQMPNLNRLFSADLVDNMGVASMGAASMGAGSSFTSSTVVMSSGTNGKPQIISQSSSTKIGPNGVAETRKTLQDTRSGTKKMSIGHHIGDRAHVVEREQNVYSGDAEERQEFINLDEEEAEEFDREFQQKAGMYGARNHRGEITAGPSRPSPRLALPPAPSTTNPSNAGSTPRRHAHRPSGRRPIRTNASPLTLSSQIRETYVGSHPQRRHKHHKSRHSEN